MPFAPKAPIDLALKERIRVAYYDEERPIAQVEQVAKVSRTTLYRWFEAWEWPLRRPMRSAPGSRGSAPAFRKPPAVAPRPTDAPAAAPSIGRGAAKEPLKLRLKRLVEHRITILEHEAMSGVAVDPDANARAIELNARTLVTIERLASDEPFHCPVCDGGRPARSLDELRDDLRAHLLRIASEAPERERLQEEETARREALRAAAPNPVAREDGLL